VPKTRENFVSLENPIREGISREERNKQQKQLARFCQFKLKKRKKFPIYTL
jgi:hypothetical protein